MVLSARRAARVARAHGAASWRQSSAPTMVSRDHTAAQRTGVHRRAVHSRGQTFAVVAESRGICPSNLQRRRVGWAGDLRRAFAAASEGAHGEGEPRGDAADVEDDEVGDASDGKDGGAGEGDAGEGETSTDAVVISEDVRAGGTAVSAREKRLEALTPREVVAKLDRYIVGQADAKKAVAIALRNRWRRLQLNEDLQKEVMPKNILMVGPTGCGKTEVARRLATLCEAPFIKVEATKFTEVGFHGRDVDLIVRDLVEVSVQLTKQQKMEQFKEEVHEMAEQRILETLTGTEARPDTVESFRRLLRSGELNSRTIEIELPVDGGGGGNGPFAIEIGSGSGGQGIGDILGKALGAGKGGVAMGLLGGGGGRRMEKQRVTIEEAIPLVEEAEMEKMLNGVDIMKEAIHNAEQNGIVFIDEIDKIVSSPRDYRGGADASSEGVQRDLLPLVEGSIVNTKHGNVNTNHMLFICSGAFHSVKPADLLAELQGRLPIRVELKGLTEEDLGRILVEPEANLVRQQMALLAAEGVQLVFTEDAIAEIARTAAEMNRVVENIGARRLYTVMERITEDLSFEAADMEPGTTVTVDAALVKRRLKGVLSKSDLSKFIL